MAAARTSRTPAPESIVTVAPFRAWRDSQFIVAGGPARATIALWIVRRMWRRETDYSGHPALHPSGPPAAVQNRSRRFCRTLQGYSPPLTAYRYITSQPAVATPFKLAEREGFEPSIRY